MSRSQLVLRRAALVDQAALQRAALARELKAWREPFAFADRVFRGFRYLRAHPLITVAFVGFFALRRPRPMLRWLARAWLARRLLRAALHR